MRLAALRDVEPSDALMGGVAVIGVVLTAVLMVAASRLAWHASLPAIDPGREIAIAVQPVLDPAFASGGSAEATLPERWRRRDETVEDATDTAVPQTKRKRKRARRSNKRKRSATPLPGVTQGPEAIEPSSEIELPDLIEPSTTDDTTGETLASPADEAEPDPSGTGDESPPAEPAGVGDSTSDGSAGTENPIVAAYRARLIRWLSARFRVTGSGLSAEELRRYRVRATLFLDDDATVIRFDTEPSGNAAFDEAGTRALESIRGEGIPPPPPGYPEALPKKLDVTFVCSEKTCD